MPDQLISHEHSCTLCPHRCGADREKGEKGRCKAPWETTVARAELHHNEEPCLSGHRGSGTVFFSPCNLSCLYCQNYMISQEIRGVRLDTARLARLFIHLQEKGAHNINLVSPTPYIPQLARALDLARRFGLNIPVVYNTHAYENVESLSLLADLVDVYLPDLKYSSDRTAIKFSAARGYFDHATRAIREMYRQVGAPRYDEGGLLKQGLMIRHLLLPGHLAESRAVLDWIAGYLPHNVALSLLAQYTPLYLASGHPPLDRTVTKGEYNAIVSYAVKIGLVHGYRQAPGSAGDAFVPDFSHANIPPEVINLET